MSSVGIFNQRAISQSLKLSRQHANPQTPCERVEADRSGITGHLKDPVTGDLKLVYLFVAAMFYGNTVTRRAFCAEMTVHRIGPMYTYSNF